MHSAKRAQIEQALLDHKPYKDIAREYRVSFRDITRVAKEMREPDPFDIFRMVLEPKTPIQIADETGLEFWEVKKIYGECVELLEFVERHSKSLSELRGSELLKQLKALGEDKGEEVASNTSFSESNTWKKVELLARSGVGAKPKYICAIDGEPLKEEDVRNLRPCPRCGRTNYKEV